MDGELLVQAAGCTGTPSSTTSRPPTTVCRAATGPQRSHASTGSDSAPANRTPSSGQTARSPQAPTDSSPISPARPRQAGAAAGGDLQGVPRRHRRRRRAAACPAASPSGPPATARPSPPTTSRRSPSPTGAPGRPQLGDRRQPAAQDHVATTGSAPRPRRAAPSRATSSGVGPDAVRHPRPVAHPADVLEVVDRPAAERRQAERVLVLRLGQVGVQPDVEPLGQLGRAASSATSRRRTASTAPARCGSWRGGERSWCASTSRCESARISSSSCTTRVRRQPAVLHRQRHRAAGRVEPHAEVAGGGDLGGDQVAGAARVHVEVVGGGGAAAQRQLGEADVGADVRRLLVQPGPQRVERDQPVEQAAGQRGRERAGQVLVEVVVGVDQARA